MIKMRLDIIDVLQSFSPNAGFTIDTRRRLWVRTQYNSMIARVAQNSGSLAGNYGKLGFGGTTALVVGQLVRWWRNQSRVPLTAWRYWASDTIKLCNDNTVRLLEDSSYCDPKKTCCVLCGGARCGDWWNLDGVTGPCCTYSRCQQPRPKG